MTELIHVYNKHPRATHARVLTTTTLVSEISKEYSIITLNASLRTYFRLHRTPYARMDYCCYPSDWLQTPSLPLKRSRTFGTTFNPPSSVHHKQELAEEAEDLVFRSTLYEVMVGDIVRIIPETSLSHRRDMPLCSIKLEQLYDAKTFARPMYIPPALHPSQCTLGLVLHVFPTTQQARILHLYSPKPVPTTSSQASSSCASNNIIESKTEATDATLPSVPDSVSMRTTIIALSKLETEYDRCGTRALRVPGVEQCVRSRDKAGTQKLWSLAQFMIQQILQV